MAHDSRGPFSQASNAMYSLKNYIAENLGKKAGFTNILFTWAVLFPHCDFDKNDSAAEKWQIFNNKDNGRPFSDFIKNLFRNAHEHFPLLAEQSILLGYLCGGFIKSEVQHRLLDNFQNDTRREG